MSENATRIVMIIATIVTVIRTLIIGFVVLGVGFGAGCFADISGRLATAMCGIIAIPTNGIMDDTIVVTNFYSFFGSFLAVES